jgi:crotonobetainyl-CoA:carnitine CoA-transferase CaiB-like acyl-CoA transferase
MSEGPLSGLRVIDCSHQYAGALAGSILADFGAEVIAIEHPSGNQVRSMLPQKEGHSLWWKVAGRGKRNITLSLSSERGRELLIELLKDADVMIENFRPGTLEKWRLGPDDLDAAGVGQLAMLRISGFGQTGSNRTRPGFGSVAEAMSGFSHLTGMPDGPPVFPSTTLADGVTGTTGCLGLLATLLGQARGRSRGKVEVIDASLVESMFRLIPTQVIGYDQLGLVPTRPGNYIGDHGVLRNLYESRDGVWFTASAVGKPTIVRILTCVGAEDMIEEIDETLASRDRDTLEGFFGRADQRVTAWASAHDWAETKVQLQESGVVFEKVYTIEDIFADPFFTERNDIIDVPDEEVGSVKMQGITPKLPSYDLSVKHTGQSLGHDNEAVFNGVLGLSEEQIAQLAADGVI